MSDYEYRLKKKEELKIMMLELKNNRLESSKLFSLSPFTVTREKWFQNMKKKKRLQKKIAMHYGEQKVWKRKIFELDEEDVLFCKKINRIFIKNGIYNPTNECLDLCLVNFLYSTILVNFSLLG